MQHKRERFAAVSAASRRMRQQMDLRQEMKVNKQKTFTDIERRLETSKRNRESREINYAFYDYRKTH
jgi:hypothetical protein